MKTATFIAKRPKVQTLSLARAADLEDALRGDLAKIPTLNSPFVGCAANEWRLSTADTVIDEAGLFG